MPAIAGRGSSITMRATRAFKSPAAAPAIVPPTKITKRSAKPTRDAARQLKYVPTAHPPNKTAGIENKITPVCQSAEPIKAMTAAPANARRATSASQLAPTSVSTRAPCNVLTRVPSSATVDVGCAVGGGVHLAFASSLAVGRDACGDDPADDGWTERITSSIARSLATKASIQ